MFAYLRTHKNSIDIKVLKTTFAIALLQMTSRLMTNETCEFRDPIARNV